jgi:hypothetical protein
VKKREKDCDCALFFSSYEIMDKKNKMQVRTDIVGSPEVKETNGRFFSSGLSIDIIAENSL